MIQKRFDGKAYAGDSVRRTLADSIVYNAAGRTTAERYGRLTALYMKQKFNSRGQLWEVRPGTTYNENPIYSAYDFNRGLLQFHYGDSGAYGQENSTNNGNLRKAYILVPTDGEQR